MSTELIEASTEEAAKVKMVTVKGERLTGEDLLTFAKEHKGQPVDDIIYGAGYYTKKTNPETEEVSVTVHKTQFWAAISAASNPDLDFAPPKRAWRSPSTASTRPPAPTIAPSGAEKSPEPA